MKRDISHFTVPVIKTRAHRVLFDDELPFKPKIYQNKKNQYQRKVKHKKDLEFFQI